MSIEKYVLSDWINAPKVKNTLNSNIKIDVMQLQNNTGYILSIYEETNTRDVNILYRVPVECSLANNWSLSTLEAIQMLNTLGFQCTWEDKSSINMSAYDQLVQLDSFGWLELTRNIRPAEVIAYSKTASFPLSTIIPNFNYSDWDFIPVDNVPVSIKALIASVTVDEVPEDEPLDAPDEATE